MKIRIYTPFFPIPFHNAALHVIYNQCLALLRQGNSVELCCWKTSVSQAKAAFRSVPHALTDAVTFRFFQEDPAKVFSFADLSGLSQGILPGNAESIVDRGTRIIHSLLSDYASPELYYYPPELDHRARVNPVDLEIYQYSFAHAWLKNGRGDSKRTVVHFHNLESKQFQDRSADASSFVLGAPLNKLNAAKLRKHEVALLHLVDEIWQLSPVDLAQLELAKSPGDLARQRFVPPSIEADVFEKRQRLFNARQVKGTNTGCVFGFIGGLDYGPNRASVEWILREVAPHLSAKGFNGKLEFAGKKGKASWRASLPPFPFVTFSGFVDDPEVFWGHLSFFLIPHVTGSGVRIKLLEAIASGVPTLANAAAIASLSPELQASPLIFAHNNPEAWAKILNGEQPFQTRSKLALSELPAALNGDLIYSFLKMFIN